MIFCQDLPYPAIFIQYVWRDHHFDLSFLPGFQDLVRRAAEENAQNEYVCVEDDFHVFLRALDCVSDISPLQPGFFCLPARFLDQGVE